ncbi:restriction endonuclease subunit S [Patescibacteria group bacterium]|nr:restriction endonuclease subunit S [Patescibacteria group bacterium]
MKTNWQIKKLGEVLEYEQPTSYIVSSKNYRDDYETPVLTAGKSFILGKTKEKNGIFPKDKLPVIIFDDFTTATKFVDFLFKVKSSAMKILHPVKNISDAKFLFYLIQNISFDHTGIHKRYWISEYSKIEILLPPLPEQHRIVKILDEVFEKIAKAKENAEKNLQNAKDLFESYLQSVFFVSSDVKKIGDICKVIAGQSPEGKFYNKSGEGMPFYQGKKEFREKYIGAPTTWTTDITKEAQNGDILMSVRAPVGPINFATEKICVGRGLAAIRAGKDVDKNFVFYNLLSKQKEIVGNVGAVFASINKADIENIDIPFPPLSQQHKIVAKLDALSEQTKKLESIYKQKLADLEELKKSVLKSAFAGKL